MDGKKDARLIETQKTTKHARLITKRKTILGEHPRMKKVHKESVIVRHEGTQKVTEDRVNPVRGHIEVGKYRLF